MLKVANLTRVFEFNGVQLPDPGASFTTDEVKDIYSMQYPDLSTAYLEQPVVKGDLCIYKFLRNVGTKG